MLSVKINKLYKILLFITCINTPVNSYGLWNWDNNFHYSDLQAYIGIAIGYNNYRMGSGFNHIRYDSNVIKKGRLFNQQTNNASVFISTLDKRLSLIQLR